MDDITRATVIRIPLLVATVGENIVVTEAVGADEGVAFDFDNTHGSFITHTRPKSSWTGPQHPH
jgi:hypothetical protein